MKFILTFDDYDQIWHENFQRRNPMWRSNAMYTNGQLDDIPFSLWGNLYGDTEQVEFEIEEERFY